MRDVPRTLSTHQGSSLVGIFVGCCGGGRGESSERLPAILERDHATFLATSTRGGAGEGGGGH